MSKVYAPVQLGPKQSMTPEGFLLCEGVAIARTGTMLYGPYETPVTVGADGYARIDRVEAEVFSAKTMASFEGKPVVNDHPSQDVTPENWRELTVGVVLNVRRGTGDDRDCLLADLLITVQSAIDLIKRKGDRGKREVSCGYDAEYEETSPGFGRQVGIIGNHVALVDMGRCGTRCAIGDQATNSGGAKKMTLKEKFLNAFKNKNEGEFAALLNEVPESAGAPTVHIIHTADSKTATADAESEKRLEKLEAEVKDCKEKIDDVAAYVKDRRAKDAASEKEMEKAAEEQAKKTGPAADDAERMGSALELEAPPGTGEAARKAKDSAYLVDSWKDTVALAEIIQPGVAIPTFDKAAAPTKTYDNMCAFRRNVLTAAMQEPETKKHMDEIMAGHDLKAFTCDRLTGLFRAVGAFKKRANGLTVDNSLPASLGVGGGTGVAGDMTPAKLNELYRKEYAAK